MKRSYKLSRNEQNTLDSTTILLKDKAQQDKLKEFLEKEFKSKVEIIKAEESKNPKAMVAEPSKPGILVE